MSGKKETYVYGSLRERFALEWKIFALAFVFILIADNIGQIKIPVGKGMFILFPIFYAIILGVLSGPQVLKIVDNRHVKAASKLVVVGIICTGRWSGRPGENGPAACCWCGSWWACGTGQGGIFSSGACSLACCWRRSAWAWGAG